MPQRVDTSAMNSSERVFSLLKFLEADRPPVIPEIFGVAATLTGETPRNYVSSGSVLAKCQIEARKMIGHDAVFAVADLCVEPEAIGCGIVYPEDNYPYVKEPVIQNPADFKKLSVPDPRTGGRMPEMLNAVRILKKEMGGCIPVVAGASGPMTIASRIMDIEKMLYMIVDEPARFREILDYCGEVCFTWMFALAAEGADIVIMSDPASSPSVLPAKIYREFAEGSVHSIFTRLKQAFPEKFTWYSVAGPLQNNTAIISYAGADITTVDYVVPIEAAMEYSGITAINGNVKPLLFLESNPDEIRAEARKLFKATRVRERFILGSGCEIPLYSAAENIKALVRAAEEEKTYFEEVNSHFKGAKTVSIFPHKKKIYVKPGSVLLDAINHSGVQVTSYCTRSGSCGKCLVKLKRGSAHYPGEPEYIQLQSRDGAPDERLACHIRVDEEMDIYIPYFSRILSNSAAAAEGLIKTSVEDEVASYGFSRSIVIESIGEVSLMSLPMPLSCEEWLRGRFPDFRIDPDVMGRFASLAQGEGRHLFAVLDADRKEILDFSVSEKIYGLAVDIGTTTISAYVHDLRDGKLVCVGSTENAQNRWGQDIITRSTSVINDPSLLGPLQRSLVEGINYLISTFHQSHSLPNNQIYDMTIVGNPVIIHLLLGLNPELLTQSPFIPTVTGWISMTAGDFHPPADFSVNPKCRVEVLPSIGGFVGADAVAGVLAASMHRKDEMSLFVDIGTNGEVVLGNKSKLFCTSVAAGPAFEGPSLTHGHMVRNGIISSMKINGGGEFVFKTIGGSVPLGLCGSAVIDILSEFVRHKLIDDRGKFLNEAENPNIKNGHYIVVAKQKTAIFKPITVSGKDIEEIQKAKSAIRTAIDLLIMEAHIRPEDIRNIYLSGTFGVSINVENAKMIGMIPDFPWAKVRFIKNSAGVGARIALLSRNARMEARAIPASAKYLNLANHPEFIAHFIGNMLFPAPR
ncbi:MAG: DUF4445 domain-containing protein [Nitrospinae bacterium]|nr:DUF4445 domain-containing protein [Nitrospinota bacterium]